MIEGVLFDLFETLVTEFDPDWRPPKATIADRLGVDEESFVVAWRERQRARFTGALADYAETLRDICLALDRPVDESLIDTLRRERVRKKARPLSSVAPAVLAGLRRVSGSGVRMAVVSNCSPEEVAGWHGSGLSGFFDDAVFSYEAGMMKPDLGIYRLACRRLGVAPERTAFVGDGGNDELAGAARAGLTAYRATWFGQYWPDWRSAGPSGCVDLATPAELADLVEDSRTG